MAIKVGIVAENYFPTIGGIQEHVYHLKRELRAEGIQATVLTGDPHLPPAGPADAEADVVRVGRAWRYPVLGTFTYATLGLDAMGGLARALRAGRFDLLHIHGPLDVGLPLLARAMFRGPLVYTLHSCFPASRARRLVSPLYQLAMNRADAIIAVSEATRAAVGRYARFDAEIIPNGVDVAYWEKGHALPRFADGADNLLYLGRLEPRNGFDGLLEAFPRIAAARPGARLLVAGDGPSRRDYEARVPPALRDRVVFLGAVHGERPDLFASARMLIIPARAVGFSIMVLEAQASGLPVVALPALGMNAAGDHWETAVLARDETPGALAEAVLRTLSEDSTARIAEGRRIARRYDWSVIAPRVADVYRRVLRL